jgi:hypothetical protein
MRVWLGCVRRHFTAKLGTEIGASLPRLLQMNPFLFGADHGGVVPSFGGVSEVGGIMAAFGWPVS